MHELGAREIGKDQSLAHHQRRPGEHRHGRLPRPDLSGVLAPEIRISGRVHLGGKQRLHPAQRGLTFQHRLRGRQTVVVGLVVQNGIEREPLSLQRVHHLVGHHHPQLSRVRSLNTKQGSRVGIVVPRDLLGVQLQQQGSEIQRIGQEAEHSVSGLQPLELGRRQLVIQLAEQVLPHLGPGPKAGLWR
ncbi:MAG: hypothetical protein ACJ8AY_07735 [Gemmatimonadales bacterium]